MMPGGLRKKKKKKKRESPHETFGDFHMNTQRKKLEDQKCN